MHNGRAKYTLLWVIIPAVVLPCLALLVPVPKIGLPADVSAQEFHGGMFGTVLFAWLHIGAALLFWQGMDAFKERLRRAYRAICVGLIAISIAMFQIPFFMALALFESRWVEIGLLPLPYVLAGYMLYRGVRSFALAVGDVSAWGRQHMLLPALLIAAISTFYSLLAVHSLRAAMESAVVVFVVLLLIVTSILVLRIKQRTGPAYTRALAWLFIALTCSAVSMILPPLALVLGQEQGSILALPVAIAAALYVKAGYEYSKILEY